MKKLVSTFPKGLWSALIYLFCFLVGAVLTLTIVYAFTGPGSNTPPSGTAVTSLPISSGGTAATSASAARANLGIAASATNTDITSLTPYTGSPIQFGSAGIKFNDGTVQTTAASGTGSQWTTSGSNIYYSSGDVGIGTNSLSAVLDVLPTNGSTHMYVSTFGCGGTPSIYTGIGFNSTLTGCTTYSLLSDGTSTFVNAPAASGSIYFRTGNSNYATLNSTGLGLGTAPGYLLDVAGTARIQTSLLLSGTSYAVVNGTGQAGLVFNSAGSDWGKIQNDSANTWSLSYTTSGGTTLGTPVLTWNGSGEVGIDNSGPSYQFQVSGGGNGDVALCSKAGCLTGYTGTAYPTLKSTGSYLYLDVNSTYVGYLASSAFTYYGTIHSTTGGIEFPDGSVQTTAALLEYYTTPGSYTFTVPTGITSVNVLAVGGGGGGGGGAAGACVSTYIGSGQYSNTYYYGNGGGGGGAGGVSETLGVAVTPGANITVTVGGGGSGGGGGAGSTSCVINLGGAGAGGSNSSFGSSVVAYGGGGGGSSAGSPPSGCSSEYEYGGASGSGGTPPTQVSSWNGGAQQNTWIGGVGQPYRDSGNSLYCGTSGGIGGSVQSTNNSTSNASAGSNASGYGNGGGGGNGGSYSGSTLTAGGGGGNGTAGYVEVWW